jgi:RNA-directed DNA polymerase
VTLEGGLPQGSCTSPALADQILRPVDTRLQSAFERRGITYTRWVDDITLSAFFSMRSYIKFIEKVLGSYGLAIHRRGDKAPVQFGPGEHAIVTGLAVSTDGVAVPRAYIETVKRELRLAWRFSHGYSMQPPPYGRETYWGTIQYIRRFSRRQARELMHAFNSVQWDKLSVLGLPGKRGRVVFPIGQGTSVSPEY